MKTNFFTQVADLNLTGNLQMIIAKGANDTYVVSVLLQNNECGDNAKNLIPPLNLKGTIEELDDGFFENVTKPLQTVSGLMVDMENFLKQAEEAKKQSAMVKKEGVKTKDGKSTKASKYDTAMAKVNELDKAGQPRQAWMALPKPEEYPEHAEAILKRRSELSAQFAPDLFANAQQEDENKEAEQQHSEQQSGEGYPDEETADEMQFEKNEY